MAVIFNSHLLPAHGTERWYVEPIPPPPPGMPDFGRRFYVATDTAIIAYCGTTTEAGEIVAEHERLRLSN